MKIAIFFTLIVLSISLNCPLSPGAQSTCFSGILSAAPDAGRTYQDMSYTQNYDTALAQIPQVCLSICGYEDQNSGIIQLQVDRSQITQQSFLVRVQTPANNKWSRVDLSYLVSTKPQIQIGLVTATNPQYDSNGFIALPYSPTIKLTQTIKIRPFIVALNIAAQSGGLLAINYENTQITADKIYFYYSSRSCNIYALSLSVVIFDPTTPGLLFLDGSIEQNSLSTTTETKVDRTYVEQLRIYFVGFSSINAKDSSGLSVGISFSSTFSIKIDSTHISSIKVNYLVISFVQCGSCTGYPLPYNGNCYQQCPAGTVLNSGLCVPINCGNGYQLDSYNNCVPVCGVNEYFSGQICSCKPGYNLINGVCSQCPAGTYYNYLQSRCESACGPTAQYNPQDGRCYCLSGYYIINGRCSACPPGTTYNYSTQTCAQNVPQCGPYQQYTQYGCQCISGYYSIQGQCQKCDGGRYYDSNYKSCVCPNGYQWNSNSQSCVPITINCGVNEIFSYNQCICVNNYYRINGVCQACPANSVYNPSIGACTCSNGYSMNGGVCQPNVPTCKDNQYLVNNVCQCRPGYSRNIYGICSPIVNPQCNSNEKWNGTQCICVYNCQPNCPSGTFYDSNTKTCRQNCGYNQVWNGYSCVCQGGLINNNGVCQPPCPTYADYVNGVCQCKNGYTLQNNQCIIITCQPGQRWDQNLQKCVSICNTNEQWVNGACQCIQGMVKINGICSYCPTGTQWNPVLNQCVPIVNCPSPHQYINGVCVCANGYERNSAGVCIQSCPPGYTRNSSGNCIKNCNKDQIIVNGQCQCRVGTYNVNGVCSSCPEYSIPVNGGCQCTANGYILIPGTGSCPVPNNNSNCGSNGYWDQSVQCCKCHNPYVWILGGCNQPQNCGPNAVWTGNGCICQYGYVQVNGQCQRVNQNPVCPPNSKFNGVNCQCNDGYFPINNNGKCEKCPSGTYWTGQGCGRINTCNPGFYWDNTKNCCVYQNYGCGANQYWDGANCRCNQGYFYINGACTTCPYGSVFDGKQCSQGQPSNQCNDPYSYYNGNSCVCLPNYWLLAGGCVSCPPLYQWSGVCCLPKRGITRAISDTEKYSNTVAVQLQ